MEKLLTMNDSVNIGKNKKVLVSELVPIKGKIFSLIKKGFLFDDEVLKESKIKKIIRDVKVTNVFVTHTTESKTYSKETESLKNILKSINTLENQTTETFDEQLNNQQEIENIISEEEEDN